MIRIVHGIIVAQRLRSKWSLIPGLRRCNMNTPPHRVSPIPSLSITRVQRYPEFQALRGRRWIPWAISAIWMKSGMARATTRRCIAYLYGVGRPLGQGFLLSGWARLIAGCREIPGKENDCSGCTGQPIYRSSQSRAICRKSESAARYASRSRWCACSLL